MQHTELNIELLSWQVLKDVPSASGIVKLKDNFYVIGDDSPYLFHIDQDFNLLSKTPIYATEKLKDGRIPKIDKPDFEAMEMISETEMLVFGSGSKSPERNVCIWVHFGKEITYTEYDISMFYEYISEMEIMQGYELDIEGFTRHGATLYLFNRGRNIIFSFSYADFLAYCKTGTDVPIPKTNVYALPKINGLEAGFSGATTFKKKSCFIFTAAVEDAPDAYQDGPILGSFIGVIAIQKDRIAEDFLIKAIPNQGFPLKVESVIVDKVLSDTQTDLVLVTDNDGEPSEILKLRMTLDAV